MERERDQSVSHNCHFTKHFILDISIYNIVIHIVFGHDVELFLFSHSQKNFETVWSLETSDNNDKKGTVLNVSNLVLWNPRQAKALSAYPKHLG